MTKKQFRTCLQLLSILLVLLVSMSAYVVGKYIKNISFNGSVTFTASLAENMILQEHLAVRQNDGSYNLDMSETVFRNSYILIPGLDIPKDPHIIITGKTPIEAYLYVEIESPAGMPLSYSVDHVNWELLTTDGRKSVYYYNRDDKPVIGNGFSQNPISIFSDNQITVSQTLLTGSDTGELKIRAVLIQKVGNKTPQETYGMNS